MEPNGMFILQSRLPMIATPARRTCRPGFSLLELLIVLAIIAVLVAVLVPVLSSARIRATITQAHSDLRQIGIALEAYSIRFDGALPPTRCGCGSNVQYQLPVELAALNLLPRDRGKIPQVVMPDAFKPDRMYKYRACGSIWLNGAYYDADRGGHSPTSYLWVPDDSPHMESESGAYYYGRRGDPTCPVRYAVWSIGPDPLSPKFPQIPGYEGVDESRFPLPKRYWLLRPGDTGLITHFQDAAGNMHMSP